MCDYTICTLVVCPQCFRDLIVSIRLVALEKAEPVTLCGGGGLTGIRRQIDGGFQVQPSLCVWLFPNSNNFHLNLWQYKMSAFQMTMSTPRHKWLLHRK